MLTVADIYCGAGGLSAGFARSQIALPDGTRSQYQLVYGIDKDCDAIRSFRNSHFNNLSESELNTVAPCADIAAVIPQTILDAAHLFDAESIDVLIGGPNCQGVSAAGLRNPEDARNDMLHKFIELVESLRPAWFVMENVPGLTHANNRDLLAAIFERFEKIENYRVAGDVLLAADYGVAQMRYRLFVVGTRTNSPILFPNPTRTPPAAVRGHLEFHNNSYEMVEDAIGDLVDVTPGEHPPDSILVADDGAGHYCARINALNRARIGQIECGGDWRNMPIGLLPERYFATRASDQKGAYGRLSWDWPAFTITRAAGNVTAGPFIHPQHDRPLSVREAARLQSFDDTHMFFGSVMSKYRQVGNAVPPRLAAAVAQQILLCHHDPDEARKTGREGRLNYHVVDDALKKKIEFPTLTPRQVHPLVDNLGSRKRLPPKRKNHTRDTATVWDSESRPVDPYPEHTRLLRLLAQQPGNYRAAKRARAIVAFIDGVSKKEIVADTNASEKSIGKWVDGYFAEGLNGWRAYHTPLERIANYDEVLVAELEESTNKIRGWDLKPASNGTSNGQAHKRYHMNEYLVSLKERFKDLSVAELIGLVEVELGHGIGTIYVDDLLAIADVVLRDA